MVNNRLQLATPALGKKQTKQKTKKERKKQANRSFVRGRKVLL